MHVWTQVMTMAHWNEIGDGDLRFWSARYAVPAIATETVAGGTITIYLCGMTTSGKGCCVPTLSDLTLENMAFYEDGELQIQVRARGEVFSTIAHFPLWRAVGRTSAP